MDNGMDNCPKCGASYALVGRVHNCRPKHEHVVDLLQQPAIKAAVQKVQSPTYKYRNPVKRRAQMAAAMRAYRGRLKKNAGARPS